MGHLLIVASGLFFWASASAAQIPVSETADRELQRLWQIAHQERPAHEQYLDRQVADVALALVGRPYERSPLGEGQGADPDPRLRLDAFDCTTFIETVAAIALAESPELVSAKLDELRYDGREPTYENRLHLVAAQWLPAWQRRGILREVAFDDEADLLFHASGLGSRDSVDSWRSSVTLEIAAEDLELARSDWMRGLALPDLPWDELPTGEFELPIVLLQEGAQVLGSFRDSLVLQVVRRPRPGRPWMVTHQALVVRRRVEDRWVSRVVHASSALGEVVEVTMDQFLAAQGAAERWPVVGINVQVWGETQPRWVRHEPVPFAFPISVTRAVR